ncbi:nitrate ABC transporter substrate-binding protein [Reyranella sp. CPCC 100927]|nr:ABC transporter substrate-binding protein [Reyranella sp. CPCC 100927]TWT14996.1 nitrate ABC transporter substrate-binding protein [Reyranella sp. CPCC 100927]
MRMISIRWTRRGVALATLGLLLLAPAGAIRAQDPVTVRIGFASIGIDNRPFAGGSSAAIAHANRYVEDEFKNDPAIKVEWFFFKGAGPAVNEAFANGQLDFALQGDLPSVIGRASGLKTKILLASGAHAPIYLAAAPGSNITSVKDLKGRKVSIFRGTNNHLAAVKVLAANGLGERDLQVINMDEASTNAALASKNIDAAFGNFGLLLLADQGLATIVYTTKGDNPAFERHSTLIATEAFANRRPELTARLVKALTRASWWSSQEENRDAVFAIWAKSGRPAAAYKADFADQPLKYRNSPLIDDSIVAHYRYQAQQAREFGLIRRDVSVEGWFAPQFLDAALKELGLETFWTRYGADGKPASGS